MDSSNSPLVIQKRLFIGIKISLSENLLKALNVAKIELIQYDIKWVKPENYHITLRFLGNTTTSYINELNKAITNSISNCPNFKLHLSSTGTFGKSKPKTLWIGIKENPVLSNIYDIVDTSLKNLGFEFKEMEFHPHLTIGRIKNLPPIYANKLFSDKLNSLIKQECIISEICLFESILNEKGPTYIILKSYKLK